MSKSKIIIGYIFAILAAISFGIQPLIASFAYSYGISPYMLAFFESAFLVPIFLIYSIIKKNSFKISSLQFLKIGLISILGAVLTTVLLYNSYLFIDTSVATTLNFTYPIFVLIISAIFFKTKIKPLMWIALVFCVIGVCLFMNVTGNFTIKGFILALLSGLTYGLYIIFSEKFNISDEIPLTVYLFYLFLISSITLFLISLFTKTMSFNIKIEGYLIAFIFSLIGGVLAFVMIQLAIKYIGAPKVSILGSIEPLTSVIAGIFFLNESFNLYNIIGIILIITSTILLVVDTIKAKK